MKPRLVMAVLTAMMLLAVWREADAQGGAATAAPPASIPTLALNSVARHGFVYAGGQYVGEWGSRKEATIGGATYVEVMVPKQIRSPYPAVFLHGAGQTGTDWLQTPDGRPGWAYNFLDMGYHQVHHDLDSEERRVDLVNVGSGESVEVSS